MHEAVRALRPAVVVVDPISNLSLERSELEVKPTLMRLIDFLKQQQITTLFTSLTTGNDATSSPEDSQVGVSSLMDTWLLLRNVEFNGERNRTIYVLKSRGTAHSNQVREFVLSDRGLELVEVYLGSDRVLTGTARVAQENQERAAAALRAQNHDRRLRQLGSRRKALEAQIAALEAEISAEAEEVTLAIAQEAAQGQANERTTEEMAARRGGTRPGLQTVEAP
jgi:circadian clock protein KaiC